MTANTYYRTVPVFSLTSSKNREKKGRYFYFGDWIQATSKSSITKHNLVLAQSHTNQETDPEQQPLNTDQLTCFQWRNGQVHSHLMWIRTIQLQRTSLIYISEDLNPQSLKHAFYLYYSTLLLLIQTRSGMHAKNHNYIQIQTKKQDTEKHAKSLPTQIKTCLEELSTPIHAEI